jgi:integrase
MPTHQDGQIIERSGAFYVRYYTNGQEGRKRVAHRLCVKDAKHRSATAASVKQLADEHMLKVNAEAGAAPRTNPRDLSVTEFWDETYLTWATENLRASSVKGYKKIWKQHLSPHFKQRLLRDYRTHQGSVFLTDLNKTLSRNTLQHVRSLASGIFTHALNLGLIESNPWHDVKVLAKTRAAGPTQHYTLEEAENIVTALVSRVDAQAVFSLAFFLGLRPSEISGLKWEDVDAEYIHIRRAAVQGVVGDTKSHRSQRSIMMIQPVKGLLQLWRQKSGNPSVGWVFPNAKGGPLNVVSFVRIAILPLVKKANLKWKGLYSARRGCATMLVNLTGDVRAGFQVLGNSYAVLEKNYLKPSAEAGLAGLKLLEAKAAGDDKEPVQSQKS